MGAGVPRPVHPKSQTQRSATAKPSTEGTAAIQRHRAAPEVSTLKPSQEGSNQNQSKECRAHCQQGHCRQSALAGLSGWRCSSLIACHKLLSCAAV